MNLVRNGGQPAPRALWSLLHANFPRTRLLDDGSPQATAGGASLAIGLDASDRDERWLGDQLFAILVQNADELGAERIHWTDRAWSRVEGGPRSVETDRPRPDRLQVDFTPDGSVKDAFPRTMIEVAVLRSGLEDLARSFDNLA